MRQSEGRLAESDAGAVGAGVERDEHSQDDAGGLCGFVEVGGGPGLVDDHLQAGALLGEVDHSANLLDCHHR